MTLLATVIKVIHFLLVVFIIATPFIGTDYMLSMHFMIVPFIMAHWLTNQSVCALTEMEKLISGKNCDEETFFGQVVGPVYKFRTQKEENLFVWTLLISLWFVTFARLQGNNFRYLRAEKERLVSLFRS